jgi:hypothetical protein
MKLLLKAFIPTFIPFAVFARVTALDNLHRNMHGEVTAISLQSLMFYFSYFAPLLYAILLLTQYLITVPLWNKTANKAKMLSLILGTCLLLSVLISYIAWSPGSGYQILLVSIVTLFTANATYWAFNLFILYIIDEVSISKARPLPKI